MDKKAVNYKIWVVIIVIIIFVSLLFIYLIHNKKFWCDTGDSWTNSKINTNQKLAKIMVGQINNESVCFVISEDKSERYAFNKDETKIYKFFISETDGKKSYGYQLINSGS